MTEISFDEAGRLPAAGDNVAIASRRLEQGTAILRGNGALRARLHGDGGPPLRRGAGRAGSGAAVLGSPLRRRDRRHPARVVRLQPGDAGSAERPQDRLRAPGRPELRGSHPALRARQGPLPAGPAGAPPRAAGHVFGVRAGTARRRHPQLRRHPGNDVEDRQLRPPAGGAPAGGGRRQLRRRGCDRPYRGRRLRHSQQQGAAAAHPGGVRRPPQRRRPARRRLRQRIGLQRAVARVPARRRLRHRRNAPRASCRSPAVSTTLSPRARGWSGDGWIP